MRRVAAIGLGVATLGLATAVAGDPAAVSARPPRHRDLAPQAPSVATRLAEIQRRVQSVAAYPALARERGLTGEALVGFEIASDGRAVDVGVVDSSGSRTLDRAAERAVRDAGSLPHVFGRIRVPVRFALSDE